MNVELPDGTVVQDVPDNISKAELAKRLQANGMKVPAEWLAQAPTKPQVPRQDMRDLVFNRGSTAESLDRLMFKAGEAAEEATGSQNLGAATYVGLNALTGFGPMAVQRVRNLLKAGGQVARTAARIEPTLSSSDVPTGRNPWVSLSELRGGAPPDALGARMDPRLGPADPFLEPSAVTPPRGRLPFVNPPEGSAAAVPPPSVPLSSIRNPVNADLMRTYQEGAKLGFKLPPSAIEPSAGRAALESLGGKAALKQDAIEHNQQVVNAIGRKVLGIGEGSPITQGAIDKAKVPFYKPYEELKALDPRAAGETGWVFKMRKARADANRYHMAADSYPPNPQAAKDAARADSLASFYERKLEDLAASKGRPELLAELRFARQELAKIGDVERAYVEGTGALDATVWARKLNRGGFLSGDMLSAARFRNAYPDYTSFAKQRAGADVSQLGALAGAHAIGTGDVATGVALGLRAPARRLALSPGMQRTLQAAPNVPMSEISKFGLAAGLAPGLGLRVPETQ